MLLNKMKPKLNFTKSNSHPENKIPATNSLALYPTFEIEFLSNLIPKQLLAH